MKIYFATFCSWMLLVSFGQSVSPYIVIDQFGYLPKSDVKFAIIRDPQIGFDAESTFNPGPQYALVNARNNQVVFYGDISPWHDGQTHEASGDKTWEFDFSSYDTPGSYYVLDVNNNVRSYYFEIREDVYNEVLKQAMRTFYYQRSGMAKELPYAEEAWVDDASHLGSGQDLEAKSFFDQQNGETARNVYGGWYDAGDYNKYTNWTANYIVALLRAYWERPEAWSDDYDIPESSNGVPDILDEVKWGLNHLIRLQEPEGGFLSVVGAAHASPPSLASGPSYYGPVNTSATWNSTAALAFGSVIFKSIGEVDAASLYLSAAEKGWQWASANPAVLFDNNNPNYNSVGLAAGRQEVGDYDRSMARLEAACYLYAATGSETYKSYFEDNYTEAHLIEWQHAYPFETQWQDMLVYYSLLDDVSENVKNTIQDIYKLNLENNQDNLPAFVDRKDAYLSYIKDFTWGSNSIKSAKGNMLHQLYQFDFGQTKSLFYQASEGYIHYLHGVNPLSLVYLSNMSQYGAEQSVNEFYHAWFHDGSALWDRVGSSTFGPPPGFLTGGPNPTYSWDACCPDNCGSADNNGKCFSESITPPMNQPELKSYKDFNTSWPLNSWEVTENSLGYQVNYIRLLSKFVKQVNSTTNLEVVKRSNVIEIFPNPTNGMVYLKGMNARQEFKLRVFNVMGQMVYESMLSEPQVNLGHLISGQYVIKVSTKKSVASASIVLQ